MEKERQVLCFKGKRYDTAFTSGENSIYIFCVEFSFSLGSKYKNLGLKLWNFLVDEKKKELYIRCRS